MFSERKKTFMDECQEHIWVISQNNAYLFIYLVYCVYHLGRVYTVCTRYIKIKIK